jgi:beta-xylosidase
MIKIKNKLFIILWLLSLGFAVQAQDFYVSTSFHEPATDGLRFIYSRDAVHWDSIPGTFLAPQVGKQKVMRDPSIIRTPDGVFHLVWTSSWRGDRGFGYAESRDLMHWSEPKFIEVMDDPTTVNVWAPEFFWDEDRQQAMVVWASCVPSQHFALGIEDEKNNHRLYYSVTKDFKTWTKGKLLIDPGFSCIDATLLKRGKNDYVMVLKDNTRNARNIKVAFAKNPMGPWSKASEPFTGNFMEGPTTVKLPKNSPLGNGYLIYYDRNFLYTLFKTHTTFSIFFFRFVSTAQNHTRNSVKTTKANAFM